MTEECFLSSPFFSLSLFSVALLASSFYTFLFPSSLLTRHDSLMTSFVQG